MHVHQHVTLTRADSAAGAGRFNLVLTSAPYCPPSAHPEKQPDLPDVAYIEQLTSALYLEKRTDVHHYLEVMNRLSAEAVTPVGTVRFLKQIIRET